MSQKVKFSGARLKRQAAKSEESKRGHEHKPSTGPRAQTAVTVRPALEPKTSRDNASLLSGYNKRRGVKAMNDEGNASKKLFEGFSDMTSTLFNPENTRKIAKLWIENSERAADEILKLQAKATEWSKNTMFAPIFEMQNSIARSCVEVSTK
jgi:hypothetical protein